jgi:anti-sigma28 factor (negative regulator of flagellin synthesis)
MKITNEHVARLLAARLQQVHRPAPPAGPHPQRDATPTERGAGRSDRAVFSSVVEDLRVGLAAARRHGSQASDGSDSARLASLAAQVRAGRYHVPADQIADALVRELRGA